MSEGDQTGVGEWRARRDKLEEQMRRHKLLTDQLACSRTADLQRLARWAKWPVNRLHSDLDFHDFAAELLNLK